jgi:hypothetical protein
MATLNNYTINWSNDSLKAPFTLSAGSIDTSTTSLALTGRGVENWGEHLVENLMKLLESFSSGVAPAHPTAGQVWYNPVNDELKMFTTGAQWVVMWPHPEFSTPSPSPTPSPTPTPTPSPSTDVTYAALEFSPTSVTIGGSTTLTLTFTSPTDQVAPVTVTLVNNDGGLNSGAGGPHSTVVQIIGGIGYLNYTVNTVTTGFHPMLATATGSNIVGGSRTANVTVVASTPSPTPGTPVGSAITYTSATFAAGPYSVGQNAVITLHFTSAVDQTVTVNTILTNPGGGLSGDFDNAIVGSLNITGGVGTLAFNVTATSTGTHSLSAQVYGITPAGTIRSDSIVVSTSGTAPVITVQPTSVSTNWTTPVTLSLTATGIGPISYGWSNGPLTGAPIFAGADLNGLQTNVRPSGLGGGQWWVPAYNSSAISFPAGSAATGGSTSMNGGPQIGSGYYYQAAVWNNFGYTLSNQVQVNYNGAFGGGSPSPGGGGGGGSVKVTAYMPFTEKQAGNLQAGDPLMLLEPNQRESSMAGQVVTNRISEQNVLKLTSESGITLTCSDNTPMTLRDGSMCNSTDVLGKQLPVQDNSGFRWETITSVEPQGRWLVATIYCLNQCYAAGDEPGRYIFTHNFMVVKE